MISEFFTSLLKRPYVFAFLAAYLFLALRLWGFKKAVVWLVSGYSIAWLSEFTSINYNFPYGEYHYIYENMPGELFIAGVPFFDSLSYPFLIFAGYSTAIYFFPKIRSSSKYLINRVMLGAFLTMFLDVIIDPIAHLGEQWFLGKIYYYPNPAWYFDVPLSNFAGWFLVSATVIGLNEGFWHFLSKKEAAALSEKTLQLCCYFFCSIALFNIIVTFSIGAWTLGVVSSTLLGSCLAAMYYTSTYYNRHTTSQN